MRHFIASLLLVISVTTSVLSAQPATQNKSQLDALWSMVPTNNDPDERHENGFVNYNGKLYLLGGRGLKRVQIFDPETNNWSDGAYPDFQMHHFQAVVYNDLIYVIGAYTGTCCDAETGVSHVWTYNPKTNNWSQKHEIPADRRRGSTGAVVFNNKIYIVGGIEGGHGTPATAYSWFDEYDPATGQWKVLPDAPRVRDHFHATVYNGKLYLIGGRNTSVASVTGATIGEVDVYDFTSNTWSTLAASKNLPTPRGAASTILYQGRMLVIGGETSGQTLAHNETEAFDPVSETWSTLGNLVVGRHATQAAIYNDAIYIAAGSAQKGGSPELNSVERYEETAVQLVQRSQSLTGGWNLIGLPLSPVDNDYQNIYTSVDLMAGVQPFAWDGASNYVPETSMSIGKAYWLRLENGAPDQSQTITGISIDALQVQLFQGWNMISGPSCDVFLLGSSTSPAGAVPESSLYGFEGSAYEPAYSSVFQRGRLEEGKGYWLYASNNAMLTMSCGSSKTSAAPTASREIRVEDLLGKVVVSDGAAKSRALLFAGATQTALNPDAFHLPPQAHGDAFDARFRNSMRMIDENGGDIKVHASELPLRITFDQTPDGKSGSLVVSASGKTYDLAPGDFVDISDANVDVVNIQFVEDVLTEQPGAFVLHGNYPNPFNPTTRIAFDLPADGDIAVEIVDLLGRAVQQLSMTNVSAGAQRSLEVDARNLPAGTYIYRVTANMNGKLSTQTGRMVLLK